MLFQHWITYLGVGVIQVTNHIPDQNQVPVPKIDIGPFQLSQGENG